MNSSQISAAYETLGLQQGCSLNDIKSAYRTLALKHHPDRSRSNTTEKMQKINQAQEICIENYPLPTKGPRTRSEAANAEHANHTPKSWYSSSKLSTGRKESWFWEVSWCLDNSWFWHAYALFVLALFIGYALKHGVPNAKAPLTAAQRVFQSSTKWSR